jgi:hypothetical protein
MHSVASFATRGLWSIAAVLVVGLGASCSSGGAGPTAGLGGGACTGTTFCVVSCSLGCDTASGRCGRSTIATNEPIRVTFSQPVDLSTVNSTTFSILTPGGLSPIGDLSVEDGGLTLVFSPAVQTVAGQTLFGFDQNQTYLVNLPGAGVATDVLRSLGGDQLATTLSCSVVASQGIVDLDGQAPRAVSVNPAPGSTNVESNTPITVEFSELLDISAFQGGTTATSPVLFRVRESVQADPNDPTNRVCDVTSPTILIPGVPTATAVDGRTVVRLTPQVALPSFSCVEVVVTEDVTDLSGKRAVREVFSYVVGENPVSQQALTETFSTAGNLDEERSNATWASNATYPGGAAVFSPIGGSGRHGEFTIDLGTTGLDGVTTIDVDALTTIPQQFTLLGLQDEPVVDAVFEFSRMVVAADQTINFVGSRAPRILVRGLCRIDGLVLANGETVEPFLFSQSLPPQLGQDGASGGPGGGSGGKGADAQPYTGPCDPNAAGENGDALVAPTSPLASAMEFANTGGVGGEPFPNDCTFSSQPKNVALTASQPNFGFGQLAAGASGGSFFDVGGTGTATMTPSMIPGELGPDIVANPALVFSDPPIGVSSLDHFLIGGSGGGGGGTHIFRRFSGTGPSYPGGGGTGGGGALGFRVGGDMIVGSSGRIEARGGDGPEVTTVGTLVTTLGGLGGGGSGGSVVMQVLGDFSSAGVIDVSGGTGPSMDFPVYSPQNTNPCVAAGGDGSGGYVRLEQPNVPAPAALGNVQGLATSIAPTQTVGTLRSIEQDSAAGFVSRFISTQQLLPPQFTGFALTVRLDPASPPIVYSDDPQFGIPLPANGPIQFFIQGARVDPQTGIPFNGSLGPWVQRVRPDDVGNEPALQAAGGQGATGFRYSIQVDLTQAPEAVIEQFEVFFNG